MRRHGVTRLAVSLEGKRAGLASRGFKPALRAKAKTILSFVGARVRQREPAEKGDTLKILTSDQARLPAEFKHINKRRKRN